MKKFLWLASFLLLCILAACNKSTANDAQTASSLPSNSAPNAATIAPSQEELNEDSQISGQYSEELSELASVEGLIALTIDIEPGNSRVILTSIDTTTGESKELRSFLISGYTHYFKSFTLLPVSVVFELQNFSSDFSKLAVSKRMPDGSSHVGWIDTKGVFTDVTAMVTPPTSDFGSIPIHTVPKFANEYFYYGTDNGVAGWGNENTIRRVPINNLSENSDELVKDGVELEYYVQPDNSVATSSTTRLSNDTPIYHDENMDYYAPLRFFCDWINAESFVGRDGNSLYLFNSKPGDLNERSFIPSIPGRYNCYPVVSPDGENIAFLSYLTTGSDNAPYLFTVCLDGSEPIKVNTGHVFQLNDNISYGVENPYRSKLLTWE